jgi:hypothetical protein
MPFPTVPCLLSSSPFPPSSSSLCPSLFPCLSVSWQAPDRYKDRAGGYCRVVRTMPRRGDNSKMGIIELV